MLLLVILGMNRVSQKNRGPEYLEKYKFYGEVQTKVV